MKTLTLLFALFACITLSTTAAEPTALRTGVDVFLKKTRIVATDPFGGPPQTYTLRDKPATDKARREIETALVRDAAKLSAELAALAKKSDGTSADAALVGHITRARSALDAAAQDKAKVAEALRQLAALR